MRDIRSDLRERLKEIPAQRMQLDQLENTLKSLLQHEEMRHATQGGESLMLAAPSSGQLSDVILAALADEAMLPEELTAHVKQCWDFGTSAAGRVVHFTTMGMIKRGQIEKHEGRLRVNQLPPPLPRLKRSAFFS